jgi:hypothetical protein
MTTKSKTHKPAAKTVSPKAAPKEETSEPKREVNEITRLVSRWRWLEADQTYQSTNAETEKEAGRLIAVHYDEEKEIERELTTLIPETFEELCCLLTFATDMVEEGGCMVEHAEIDMLRNVRTGLSEAWRNDMEAERKKAVEKAQNEMRHDVRWVIETKEWKKAQIEEFRAADQKAA